MSENKRYYWMKLKKDFFEDYKVKRLRQYQNGDTYLLIYLKLQLYSLNSAGEIRYEGIGETIENELAVVLSEEPETMKKAAEHLKVCGLLEKKGGGWFLPNVQASTGAWNKREKEDARLWEAIWGTGI